MATKYPIGAYMKQMTALLEISPERILRRVGLSPSLAAEEEFAVEAETFFRMWDAMCAEANRKDTEMTLAMAYAHGPFVPPIFAFSCAETLGLGLRRLAAFKPLIGPIAMDVEDQNDGLAVSLRPSESGLSLPSSLGLFEILYITECARSFTGVPLVPLGSSLPKTHNLDAACKKFLGHTPDVAPVIGLKFSTDDTNLPLITRSASLWETLEPSFVEQLEQRTGFSTMSGKIKRTLTEALPGGVTSVDEMAKRLNVSKRSLQRRLREEGTSFQEILNQTRFEMSERYLQDSALSVPEISYLLGFRDTSSFFRAFQGWTGTTPGDYRSSDAVSNARPHPVLQHR